MLQKVTSGAIAEFKVEDNIEQLNSELARRGVAADAVIAILPIPAIEPAIGDWTAKLRVLHRS